jgi:hypothetical protein
MDAATIARMMSLIPERAAWAHTGSAFVPHEPHGPGLAYVAPFLGWMTPLTALTKDDQRALGLIGPAHHRAAAEPLDAEADDIVEGDEELDPEATLPPVPERPCPLFSRAELLAARALEDGVEEDVAAGGEVLGPGVLDLVVADAAFAGDEDHGGGRDAREEDGVVAGAADDVAVAKA